MHNLWFKNFKHKPNAELTLFCFPHAGGNAQFFKDWENSLPEWIEMYVVQLPGRGERMSESLCSDMNVIVKNLTINILPFLKKPYIFLGHSLGGSIAFEVVKTLKKLNYKLPKHLFIVGREAPDVPCESQVYDSTDDNLLKYLRSQSGTHDEILYNDDLMELLLPMIRSDLKLADTYSLTYKKEAPLPCPLTVFWGTEEYDIDEQKITSWKNETNKQFRTFQFEGHHFFLHEKTDEVVQKIIEIVKTIE